MTKEKEKKKFKSVEEYLKEIKEGAKGAPSADEILAEFEQGDYSSLDPDCLQKNERWAKA